MYRILIVDDNIGDTVLIKEILKDSKLGFEIDLAVDGRVALEMLRNGKTSSDGLPHMIMMDLGLPKMSGIDVIQEIKADPLLKRIPLMVLTGSDSPDDIRRAYESGANCYVVKPIGIDELERALRAIEDFWFRVAKLPSQ